MPAPFGSICHIRKNRFLIHRHSVFSTDRILETKDMEVKCFFSQYFCNKRAEKKTISVLLRLLLAEQKDYISGQPQ